MHLQYALKARGLRLRADSRFCQDFIAGRTLASLDEVVATMGLTAYLFDTGGHRMWSISHDTCERHMRDSVRQGTIATWWDAAVSARQFASEYESSDDDYDDNDDDEYF
jgi:hypothetical protein